MSLYHAGQTFKGDLKQLYIAVLPVPSSLSLSILHFSLICSFNKQLIGALCCEFPSEKRHS